MGRNLLLEPIVLVPIHSQIHQDVVPRLVGIIGKISLQIRKRHSNAVSWLIKSYGYNVENVISKLDLNLDRLSSKQAGVV
jgi:hypothetical protein